MTEVRVLIESIRVDGRYRRDLGDIESLAASMKRDGLISAITVTPEMRLLAGERRLTAARRLGWRYIDARLVDTLDDALARLRIERDENTERKPMTPEELVRLGKALEELERPRAANREAAAKHRAGRARHGLPPAAGCPPEHAAEPNGKTREVVAAALGISSSTYERAKTVVDTADDITQPPEDREVAQQALADMNATGNVGGNYDKVRRVRDARLGAPQRSTIDGAKKQRRAISKAVASLSGITYGLNQVVVLHPDLTSGEAAQWVDDLSKARRGIEALIKRLREFSSAQT